MPKLPIIHQTEATECGLACVAMVANYHGHNLDLSALREQFSVSLKGATLASLISIAGALQLAPRALSLDMDELSQLSLPAILHWDMNHFVVLKSVSKTHIVVHDPGAGRRKLSLDAAANHFTGVALELSPAADFAQLTARRPARLSMLWSRITGLKRAIAQTLILSIILQILVLCMPLYLQFVIDGALPARDVSLLLTLAVGFAGLTLIRSVTQAMRSWAILIYGNQMSQQMTGNVIGHLLRLPISYFEKRHMGDIISRIDSTQPIQTALTRDVVAVFIDGIMALFTLVVMFLFSPLLTAIVLVSTLLMAIITLMLYPRQRAAQEEVINTKAAENSHVIESLRAAMAIKLFGRQSQRHSAWRNLFTDYINANTRYGSFVIAQSLAQDLLTGLQLIAVVYFGAQAIMSGDNFSLGMLFAFLMYRQMFAASASLLLQKAIDFQLLGLHLERLSDIVQARPEGVDTAQGDTALIRPDRIRHDIRGALSLRNVSFRYSDLDPWTLQDFSTEIEAGKMTVITGASGAGKTTLLKLLLGLYQPQAGSISVDGHNLRQLDLEHWRSQIGVVMQDDSLLSGSLSDNISVFDPDMDMALVQGAAQAAGIHRDIMAMPMGYASTIGDMGSSLSGGQRQRILLARALYRRPRILFLDEGTANLDLETEAVIADTVSKMPMTRVIIAHRNAFIKRADTVLTIK